MITHPAPHDDVAQAVPMHVAPLLEALGVEHRFRNGRGVGPVDLRIAPGERTALMGANGAGKTTLLRMLATATRPRRGVVRWCGSAVPCEARRLIGFAADATLDDAGLTGRQSTYFWCRQWLPGARTGVAVEDALHRFGLALVADEPIAGYSFGMRRRLALAQALAHHPRLALLDEPTAGLDADGLAVLRAELARRSLQERATLIASNDCTFVADGVRPGDLPRPGIGWSPTPHPRSLLASVGDARRVELDIASDTRPRIIELRHIDGIANAACTDGVVTFDLLDDCGARRRRACR